MLPFILPMVKAAGFDLVWFGVYVCILLEAGLLSPPVGMNLFVLQGVTGAPFSQIVWGSIPFFFILLLGNVIIFLMPELVLWLPGVMK
jgi:TRAP-type C4-dicarboxylate transport system permease large subunit